MVDLIIGRGPDIYNTLLLLMGKCVIQSGQYTAEALSPCWICGVAFPCMAWFVDVKTDVSPEFICVLNLQSYKCSFKIIKMFMVPGPAC